MSDSDLLFGDEPQENEQPKESGPTAATQSWRVLIVDDEEQVHKITALVLQNCRFDGGDIELTHAYSMAEAQTILSEQEPFALALIDVVMETDDAGLRLVEYIRETLNNVEIRLVLRTGQPGQAPEAEVIRKYDINDYKNKTELTSTKLKTLLYSTLRSYRDITAIRSNRQGLFRLIEATSKIVDESQLGHFFGGVLEEIRTVLNLEEGALCARVLDAVAAHTLSKQYEVLAATGRFQEDTHHLPPDVLDSFEKARRNSQGFYEEEIYVGYYQTPSVGENFLYVKPTRLLDKMDVHLLDMYMRCVAVTHHNLKQKEVIHRSRLEMVYVLSEAIEHRNPNESSHIRRVSLIANHIAQGLGLSDISCERIKLASALHDIGFIGVADDLITFKGQFTEEQRKAVQAHSLMGEAILGQSQRPVLRLASIIAGQHHEHWDGQGYPKQLKGEEIHEAARITAVADAIEEMSSNKPYRKALPLEDIQKHISEQLGKQFDPNIGQEALDMLPQLIALEPEEKPALKQA